MLTAMWVVGITPALLLVGLWLFQRRLIYFHYPKGSRRSTLFY
jgi:hypothetical protein